MVDRWVRWVDGYMDGWIGRLMDKWMNVWEINVFSNGLTIEILRK